MKLPARNDAEVLFPVLQQLAATYDLPYELLVAQTLQESSWSLKAYRYEPNYDRRYIHPTNWSTDPAWLTKGDSIAEWFDRHPARQGERSKTADYSRVAQTRIAASYGVFQVMYPTARGLGFRGLPEELHDLDHLQFGPMLLSAHARDARKRGLTEHEAIRVALAQYNGGPRGNLDPAGLRNQAYVDVIARRYQQCWGAPLP